MMVYDKDTFVLIEDASDEGLDEAIRVNIRFSNVLNIDEDFVVKLIQEKQSRFIKEFDYENT